VSKFVNWGHWIVAVFFAVQGIALLGWIAVYGPGAWHDLRGPMVIFVPPAMGLCAFFLVSAWGILGWRRWAHTSAIALSALELTVFVVSATVLGVWAIPPASIGLWLGFDLAVCVWLLLPTVWAKYRQRQQIA
jgi:hypothetical protein